MWHLSLLSQTCLLLHPPEMYTMGTFERRVVVSLSGRMRSRKDFPVSSRRKFASRCEGRSPGEAIDSVSCFFWYQSSRRRVRFLQWKGFSVPSSMPLWTSPSMRCIWRMTTTPKVSRKKWFWTRVTGLGVRSISGMGWLFFVLFGFVRKKIHAYLVSWEDYTIPRDLRGICEM